MRNETEGKCLALHSNYICTRSRQLLLVIQIFPFLSTDISQTENASVRIQERSSPFPLELDRPRVTAAVVRRHPLWGRASAWGYERPQLRTSVSVHTVELLLRILSSWGCPLCTKRSLTPHLSSDQCCPCSRFVSPALLQSPVSTPLIFISPSGI